HIFISPYAQPGCWGETSKSSQQRRSLNRSSTASQYRSAAAREGNGPYNSSSDLRLIRFVTYTRGCSFDIAIRSTNGACRRSRLRASSGPKLARAAQYNTTVDSNSDPVLVHSID